MNKQQRWRQRILSRAVRAVPFFLLERLEDRTLMSGFTYDLRFAPGQLGVSADEHSVDLSKPHGNSYTLQVWSQISGDTDFTNDAWVDGIVTLVSAQFGGGAITRGGIAGATMNRALFPLGHDGSPGDLSKDGIADWGSTATFSIMQWMYFSCQGQPVKGGNYLPGLSQPSKDDPLNTWEMLVGTFVINIDDMANSDAQNHTTTFNVIPTPRITACPIKYFQDGVGHQSSLSADQIGPGVTFRLPAAASENGVGFAKSVAKDSPVELLPDYFASAFLNITARPLARIQITSLPSHGRLTLGSQAVTLDQVIDLDQLIGLSYLPDSGYAGADFIGWIGSNGATQATGDINLTITNMAPVPAGTDAVIGVQNSPYSISVSSHFQDLDPGDSIQFIVFNTLPSFGKLTVNGFPVVALQEIAFNRTSSLIYTPDAGFTGWDSLTWNFSDGQEFAAFPGTLKIGILPAQVTKPPAPPPVPTPPPVVAPAPTYPVPPPVPTPPPPVVAPAPQPVPSDPPPPPVTTQPPAGSAPPDKTPAPTSPAPPPATSLPPAGIAPTPPQNPLISPDPTPPPVVIVPPADTTIPPTAPVDTPPIDTAPVATEPPTPQDLIAPTDPAPLVPVTTTDPPADAILLPTSIWLTPIGWPIGGLISFDHGLVSHPICIVWDSTVLYLQFGQANQAVLQSAQANMAGVGPSFVASPESQVPGLQAPSLAPQTKTLLQAPLPGNPVAQTISQAPRLNQQSTPLPATLTTIPLDPAPQPAASPKAAPQPGTPSTLPDARLATPADLTHSPLADDWETILPSAL